VGTRTAYYRFDESPVKDYFLGMDQTQVQAALDTEAYPKAGAANPVADLFGYDVATRATVRIDVRDGQPFDNDVVGHYVHKVGWSLDGKSLTVNRTNRRQNVMEFTACAPASGACRAVVREEWRPSWTDTHPPMPYLADGQRFIWGSDRTGFRNYDLYDTSGRLLSTITTHPFEVAGIVHVDEKAGVLFYMARDGDTHMKLQLHRAGLDGTGDKRLTAASAMSPVTDWRNDDSIDTERDMWIPQENAKGYDEGSAMALPGRSRAGSCSTSAPPTTCIRPTCCSSSPHCSVRTTYSTCRSGRMLVTPRCARTA
jgi:dipeptidyl-peptidase-4